MDGLVRKVTEKSDSFPGGPSMTWQEPPVQTLPFSASFAHPGVRKSPPCTSMVAQGLGPRNYSKLSLFIFLFLFFLSLPHCFPDRVSLCSPRLPQTYNPPAAASGVLALPCLA